MPANALLGCLVCLCLVGIGSSGPTIQFARRMAVATTLLTAMAIGTVVAALIIGRLFGPGPIWPLLPPALADLTLAITATAVVWYWSRPALAPREFVVHLPRARLAAVGLALIAVGLGGPTVPELKMVRPHIPTAILDHDGESMTARPQR